MTVWRIKINSGRDGVDWDGAKAYCRQAGVVGVGWGRPGHLTDGASLDDVVAAVSAVPDWAKTGPKMIRRLALEMRDGDLIWTRDRAGGYWLGRVGEPYRYDGSDDGCRWDLNNIRPCQWLDRPFRDYEVTGGVVRNFAGVGETLRRIKEPAAVRVTDMLWRRENGDAQAWRPIAAEEVIAGLLDPTDVEDLVLLVLQHDGWLLLPSSRMHDTPMYEAALRRSDGQLAVVSVKSGPSSPVPIPELAAVAADAGGASVRVLHAWAVHGATCRSQSHRDAAAAVDRPHDGSARGVTAANHAVADRGTGRVTAAHLTAVGHPVFF